MSQSDLMIRKRPHIALLIETSNVYGRGLLSGIIAYTRQKQNWSLFIPEQGRGDVPQDFLQQRKFDGVIARIENESIAQVIRNLNLPTIDVSSARLLPELPWVETDDSGIAEIAVDHFFERGFRTFAYAGDPQFNWSCWRAHYFCRRVEQKGGKCFDFPEGICRLSSPQPTLPASSVGRLPDDMEEQLADWLTNLPKPVGIMACYDNMARLILTLCQELDISVPEQIALIGVDNDPLICELSEPTITSIMPDAERAGWLAADLLDQWMRGNRPESTTHLVRPVKIEHRLSTDTHAIEDQVIARSMKLIRTFACQGLTVSELMNHIPLSRRIFESRFQKQIGHSPHAEIVRIRIERVKQLLINTDDTISEIARLTGYTHDEYLSSSFKQITGMSPTQFRNRYRITTDSVVAT